MKNDINTYSNMYAQAQKHALFPFLIAPQPRVAKYSQQVFDISVK